MALDLPSSETSQQYKPEMRKVPDGQIAPDDPTVASYRSDLAAMDPNYWGVPAPAPSPAPQR